jgi:hypothetical protein
LTDAGAGTALASVNQMTGPIELTLDELAGYVHPPMSREQLGRIVGQLPGLRPVGRRLSARGRPLDTYDAAEVLALHNCIRRWL